MKALCDEIHALGLKPGIYSTPWVTSYAGFPGGSSENADGKWEKPTGPKQVNKKILPWAVGKYPFATNDAKQWAEWGFDYLKYDWNPIEAPQTEEMLGAIKSAHRDVVLSLSNNASIAGASDWARLANAWRTSGDIRDNWQSMSSKGFGEDKWAAFAGPGHWNDPDMLVVGMVGWGPKLHDTESDARRAIHAHHAVVALGRAAADRLRHDAVGRFHPRPLDQRRSAGRESGRAGQAGNARERRFRDGVDILARPLADGTLAVGLFNRGRYEIVAQAAPSRTNAPPQVWKLIERSTKQATEFASEAEAKAALRKSPIRSMRRWSGLTCI